MGVNREGASALVRQRRLATRRRLVDTAAKVIAAKGPYAASIEDFAAAAGITPADFAACFPTTADLLHELNTRITRQIDDSLEDLRDQIDDPVVLLSAIMHRLWVGFALNPQNGWVAMRLDGSAAPRQGVWQEQFDILHRRGVEAGRFHRSGPGAARTLAFGAFRMGLREVYSGEVGLDHGHHLVTLLLTAFGLPHDEAEALSRAQATATLTEPSTTSH